MRWKCWAGAVCAGVMATGALAQGPGATPVSYRDQPVAAQKKAAAKPAPASTRARQEIVQAEAALAPVAHGERKIRVIPLYNLPKLD